MRRVLVVSPYFPPSNSADSQRVRTYVPHLATLGWKPDILCVDAGDAHAPQDPLLLRGLPADLRVFRVPARADLPGKVFGGQTIGRRCFRFIKSAGDKLLSQQKYDLVFFSTTAFSVFRLGPRWRRRCAVPFVIDLQDPWVNDFYRLHPAIVPPGGRLRYRWSDFQARRWEGRVMSDALGLVAVSPHYQSQLLSRHSNLERLPFLTLPFGASRSDFEVIEQAKVTQSFFDPYDGLIHLMYVGRGGPDLKAALTLLFTAFRKLRDNEKAAEKIRFHFIGTSYAPTGRAMPSVKPVAEQLGVGRWVSEQTSRIPYFEALRCLRDAHGLILPMSEDAAYNASKIHNLLLAARPVLAIVKAGSVAQTELSKLPGPVTLATVANNNENRVCDWLRSITASNTPRELGHSPCESANQAKQLTEFFDRLLEH